MSSKKWTAGSQTPASISSKPLKKPKTSFRMARDPTEGTSVHATTLRPQPTCHLRESKVNVRREKDIPEGSQVIAETEEFPPVPIDDSELPQSSTATMPQNKKKKNTTSVSYLFALSSTINHSYGLNSLSYRNGLASETTFLMRCYTCTDVAILKTKTLALFVRRRMDYIGVRIALEGVCSIAQVVLWRNIDSYLFTVFRYVIDIFNYLGFSDIFYSIGMANSLKELLSKIWDYVCSLATVEIVVRAPRLDNLILSLLIQLVPITSPSTTVIAVNVDSSTNGTNFSELVGYPQHLIALRWFSLLNCLKPTTNWPSKAKWHSMIITTPSCILPTTCSSKIQ